MTQINIEQFEALPHTRGNVSLQKLSEWGAWCMALDNPQARNALSIRMMHQLKEHLETLSNDGARVLFIRGAGHHFCAGGDLRDVREHLMNPELGRQMCAYMTSVLQDYQRSTMFIVVLLEGAAIGGGAELTTFADYVIAQADAHIAFVQAKLGVTPGWGGGQRLIERVGKRRALQLLAMPKRLTAHQGQRWGLIDCVTENVEQEMQQVMELTAQIPPNCMHQLLSWMKQPEFVEEIDAFEQTWASDAHRRALGLSS